MSKENRTKFSLVMPAYKCEGTIKKAIDSILDQDEDSWELIVVVNGQWDGREKLLKILRGYIKKDQRITMVELKEGNACSARNVGGEMATGEFISFFSSDFYMYPGALKKWEKEFKDHASADFIYSGYRLMKDGKMTDQYVPSRPFDTWELKMENYIDGGFPMRREVFEKCKWDPEVKSLNDWDFWLTVIDNGFIGYMMPEPTYSAEVPKAGGLSYDSHANWIERVEQIKKKHKIPINDVCVVSLGAQPHAKRIAKILGADFRVAPQIKPHKYKAIYLIGFYVGDGSSAIAHSQVFKGCEKECKKVVHWIGTDILQLMSACYKVCYADMKQLIDVLNECINLTEFEQAQNEMLAIGMKTDLLVPPIEGDYQVTPLPKKPVVAVYAANTPTAKQIYNLDFMQDVIRACPDIDFLLFGGGLQEFKPINVKNVGWCDIKEVIKQSSILMRVTYHDGLPVTPMEWRMCGRDAIASVQMPFVHFAGSGVITPDNYAEKKEKMVRLLRDVVKAQKKEGVKDVQKAREYYMNLTSPKKFIKDFKRIINEQPNKSA